MKNTLRLCLAIAAIILAGVAGEAKLSKVGGGIVDPKNFKGSVRQAYSAAASHQGVASKVFCYCGCDKHAGHRSLHDCFRSDHGTYCATCKSEMIKSARMADRGLPIAQIKKNIHQQYAGNYPFSTESSTLRAYKASMGMPIASRKHRKSNM